VLNQLELSRAFGVTEGLGGAPDPAAWEAELPFVGGLA
jgi:hypothetical protein